MVTANDSCKEAKVYFNQLSVVLLNKSTDATLKNTKHYTLATVNKKKIQI